MNEKYTCSEKELYSILQVCLKYRTLLLGHKIYVNTDHKALTFLKTAKLSNNRLSRWFLALQEFDLELTHVSGKAYNTADFISRQADFRHDSA